MSHRLPIPLSKPFLGESELRAVEQVLQSGWVSQGPRVKEFESAFSQYTGARYAVAVSNCTTALHLALLVAGVRPGDEVICPSLSFIATANAISYLGARPVFCDVERKTFNLDVECARNLVGKKTRAILLVHQMGLPARINEFKNLCDEKGLKLVEDAACALGSVYEGQQVGGQSDLACFSFHPRKIITTGEGGMITTSRLDYFERLSSLRQHSMSHDAYSRHVSGDIARERYSEIGFNYRLTDIQAAMGIAQLAKMDLILSRRKHLAELYFSFFKACSFLEIPDPLVHATSNYQSYWIYLRGPCVSRRNDVMAALLKRGVSSRFGIMTAHREIPYMQLGSKDGLPVSEDLSDNSILLPLFPEMTDGDAEYVATSVLEILGT